MIHILDHLTNNDILTKRQLGFLPKSSTSDVLITGLHDWYGFIEDMKSVVMALFDLSKAFDRVPHHPLLRKLGAFGLTFSPGSNPIVQIGPSWFLCTVLTLPKSLLHLVSPKALLSLGLSSFLSMSVIFASLLFLLIALLFYMLMLTTLYNLFLIPLTYLTSRLI